MTIKSFKNIAKKLFVVSVISGLCFFTFITMFISNGRISLSNKIGRGQPPNTLVINSKEGYFRDRMDRFGYNNYNFVGSTLNPYIVFHGDSYTEAFQVQRDDNFVSRVNENFPEFNCYNYGKSGNSIADYIYNSEKIYNEFNIAFNFIQIKQYDFIIDSQREDKLVYIDTSDMSVKMRNPKKLFPSIAITLSEKVGILYPFISYTYLKIEEIMGSKGTVNNSSGTINKLLSYEDKNLIDWELSQLKEKYKGQLAFVYISNNVPSPNTIGKANNTSDYDIQFKEYLQEKCNILEIDIIDTEQAFIDFYIETNQLPTGFNNTSPGSGHLNISGHSIIAKLVSEYIEDNLRYGN